MVLSSSVSNSSFVSLVETTRPAASSVPGVPQQTRVTVDDSSASRVVPENAHTASRSGPSFLSGSRPETTACRPSHVSAMRSAMTPRMYSDTAQKIRQDAPNLVLMPSWNDAMMSARVLGLNPEALYPKSATADHRFARDDRSGVAANLP